VDDLFAELKPQVEVLAEALFGASEMLVRKRGGFLPHGAVLEALYLPWSRKLLGGHVFGQVMALTAKPEVQPWGDGETA